MRHIRKIWLLFLCQTILAGGMALSFPFFALYLHRQRGLPMGLVGACLALILGITSLSQGIGGELSDIIGRRRVMILSLWGRVAAVAALAFAIARGCNYVGLLALHSAASFSGNFFDPAARSWIADHTEEWERTRVYGLLRIAVNLGWAVGPALGGLLAGRSYAWMFGWTAVACAVAALLVMAFIRDKADVLRREEFQFSGVLRAGGDRRFLRLCTANFLIAAVAAQLVITLSVHATDFVRLSEAQVGLLFSLNGLMVATLQYPMSVGWSRFRLSSILGLGSLLYAAGYIGVGFAGGFAAMAAAVAVVTFGEITVAPCVPTLTANMAPAREVGRYVGFAGLMRQLGTALGPLAGGLALQYVSPHWTAGPWVGVGLTAVCAALVFLSLRPILTPREEGLTGPEAAAWKPEAGAWGEAQIETGEA